ncbi:hypothetical protein ACQ4PT_063637 [Festuca glaucescens]
MDLSPPKLISRRPIPLGSICHHGFNDYWDFSHGYKVANQIITGDNDVAESSAQGAARALAWSGQQNSEDEVPPTFLIARTVLINMQQPNLFINAQSLWGAALPPFSSIKMFLSDKVTSSEPLMITSTLTVKRTRSARKEQVQVTTAVRRSPRNNIYKGFKVDMPTDAKKRQTKVKSRVIPDASGKSWVIPDTSETPSKDVPGSDGDASSPPIPPPTPVPVLQKIGVNICGIPPEELEKDKLENSDSDDEA